MTQGSGGDLSNLSMLDLFRMEAENHCATLTEDLLGLEQDPSAADRLESLMRAAHSLKGAARIVGLNQAVQVAHAMEDVFVAAQHGHVILNQDKVDALLKGVDMLNHIAHLAEDEAEQWLGNKGPEIDDLVQELSQLTKPDHAEQASPVVQEPPPKKSKEKDILPEAAVQEQNKGDLTSLSMLDLFRMEAENHCATLTEDLLGLEQDPSASDRLESLMRAAHSIKGAARIVGLDAIVQLAHAMEDVFVAAQHGSVALTQEHIDPLLQGVDLLHGIALLNDEAAAQWLNDQRSTINMLVKTLSAISKRQHADALPPAVNPPSGSASPAPASAQPVALSVLGLFRAETARHTASLHKDLQTLQNNPAAKDRMDSCMRAAHAIKGAALVVGLEQLGQLANAMEEIFLGSRQTHTVLDAAKIALIGKGADLLFHVAQLADEEATQWLANDKKQIDALVEELRGVMKQTAPPPAEVEAAPLAESMPIAARPKAEQSPAAPPPPKSDRKPTDRTLRVSAEGMNRLMGFAGDVLVESRWLPAFAIGILRLKRQHDELISLLDRIREDIAMEGAQPSNRILELRQKILKCREHTTNSLDELEDHARRATETSHRLYREVIANRMRPFADGIQGFPRMIRDVARELGKDVRLEIGGQDTLVDRDILDKMEAPLNHLLRNAVDHGIETPEDRLAAGKKKEATIRLEATHRSGMLNITVADDGRGVDLEGLRKTVVAKKLVSEEIAAALSESELMDFLFLPNFSTRKSVTKVSGRGVGLDVVHNVVHEVRGVVRAQTKVGQGTRFELQLPLTLSVMRALLTEISDEPYAFPLVTIDHVLKVPREAIKEVEGRQYFVLNDRRIGIVSARQILEKEPNPVATEELPIIVLSDRLNQYGLIVDRFLGIRDLVVQTLDTRLGKLKDISSAALLEDGAPVLIVDIEDMVRSMDDLISGNRLKRIGQIVDGQGKTIKRILVADDSITVREVERKMLVAKGYEVDVAVDGMDAWNTVRTGNYNLVITDVDMPRMDGVELVSLIRQDLNLYRLPVVIVSYKDRDEDRTRGLEAGADYYLTKGSFQDETLVQAVMDLIGGPEAS